VIRKLENLAKLLVLAWSMLSALLAAYLVQWFRERYRRGGPFPASRARVLLAPGRPWFQPIRRSLESFLLRPGATVLELGPGPGYFTIEASRMVGVHGRVICLDIQPEMLAILRRRLADHGVTNAYPVLGDASHLPLADGSVDCAVLAEVLGEIPDRPSALSELRRAMRPGGVLSVMETPTDPDYMLESGTKDLCRASGFAVLEHQRGWLGYIMTFTNDRT